MRFSSLRCFFFAIRLRRFLMTEPTFATSRSRDSRVVPDLITCRRLSPDNSRMVPAMTGGREPSGLRDHSHRQYECCTHLVHAVHGMHARYSVKIPRNVGCSLRDQVEVTRRGADSVIFGDELHRRLLCWERPAQPTACLAANRRTSAQPERRVEVPLVAGCPWS